MVTLQLGLLASVSDDLSFLSFSSENLFPSLVDLQL